MCVCISNAFKFTQLHVYWHVCTHLHHTGLCLYEYGQGTFLSSSSRTIVIRLFIMVLFSSSVWTRHRKLWSMWPTRWWFKQRPSWGLCFSVTDCSVEMTTWRHKHTNMQCISDKCHYTYMIYIFTACNKEERVLLLTQMSKEPTHTDLLQHTVHDKRDWASFRGNQVQ